MGFVKKYADQVFDEMNKWKSFFIFIIYFVDFVVEVELSKSVTIYQLLNLLLGVFEEGFFVVALFSSQFF